MVALPQATCIEECICLKEEEKGKHKPVHNSMLSIIHKNSVSLPYAEYEDKTMIYAEARLIEYQSGDVLFDALYGT